MLLFSFSSDVRKVKWTSFMSVDFMVTMIKEALSIIHSKPPSIKLEHLVVLTNLTGQNL